MEQEQLTNRRSMLKASGAGLGLALAGLGAAGVSAVTAVTESHAATAAKSAADPRSLPCGAFHHIGVPTKIKHENETYLEASKVYITDPDTHPYHIEWCRWMPGSESPELLRTTTHIAFLVKSVDAELAKYDKKDIFIEPFEPFAGAKVAFINHEGTLIELLQKG